MAVNGADVFHVVKDGNAEEDESKEPNEQKGNEHHDDGCVAGLVPRFGGDHVSTVWALEVGHRILSKGGCYHSRRLRNSYLQKEINRCAHTHTKRHTNT